MLKSRLGHLVGLLPLDWRYAPHYVAYKRDCANLNDNVEATKAYQFYKIRQLVEHALKNIPFYKWFYGENGFSVEMLKDFSDIARVPIVRKIDLAEWDIEQRSYPARLRRRANTGGTSGRPLGFYLDRAAYAREWFHMLQGWQQLGYHPSALKLTFRGANIGNDIYRYRLVQNEFFWNIFKPLDEISINELKKLLAQEKIQYLHGYPSAIYRFIRDLEDAEPGFCERHFRVRGVFMGSEYPDRAQRAYVERMLDCQSLSWYGHSEQAVLAMETDSQFVYRPFATYGLAEAVPAAGTHTLVATGFDNFASPFIRYDTEDPVVPVEVSDGVLKAFSMIGGRAGEVVIDKAGNAVSLTGLLYGRHHIAFEHFDYVQLHQPAPGELLIMVVTKTPIGSLESYFDLSGLQFDFAFNTISTPFRTSNGKVVALLKNL